jgi:MFS family permease
MTVSIAPSAGSTITPPRAWPSSGASYWALFVIVLATFLTFFDQVVFGMLAERIKHDFGLTDSQLGFLAGPASIICYFFVGIPLARLADIFPRKYVLAGGVSVVGSVIALGGIAQTFFQFVTTRIFLAAGGSAHAPSSYSLLADAFPPQKLTRAFALLQFGFIGGTTLGPLIGGQLVMMSGAWAPTEIAGLRILGWQWIMFYVGLPGLLIGLLFLTIKEPQRLLPKGEAAPPPTDAPLGRRALTVMGFDAFKAINSRPKVYYPLFAALALSAVEVFGLQFWRVPFMIRSYGWNEGQIGAALGGLFLVASLAGLVLGGVFVEWLAKRHRDANVRAATILFAGVTLCAIASPMMPDGWSSLIVMSIGAMFGIAGAVPQNAAVQRVAPNALRGQVTAIYLFMFIFFGALGSWFVGWVQDVFVGVEADLWKSLVITAATLLPLATFFMYKAMKPYAEEVERLEAIEKETL